MMAIIKGSHELSPQDQQVAATICVKKCQRKLVLELVEEEEEVEED